MKRKILLVLLFISMSIHVFGADEKFETYSGDGISYSEIMSAPKVVLFLWTTRCPYCREELQKMNSEPNLSHYAKFYFVDVGEQQNDVKRMVKSLKLKSHISENIIFDKNAYLAEKFSIIGVPTLIYMRNGKVIDKGYYFDEDNLKKVFRDQ